LRLGWGRRPECFPSDPYNSPYGGGFWKVCDWKSSRSYLVRIRRGRLAIMRMPFRKLLALQSWQVELPRSIYGAHC